MYKKMPNCFLIVNLLEMIDELCVPLAYYFVFLA